MSTSNQGNLKYGELVILGYNGRLPRGNRGRKLSKFILNKRPMANGVKPSQGQSISNGYRIIYAISKSTVVTDEYDVDEHADMFQVGRSSEASIDFVVMDVPTDSSRSKSLLSRFACRILVNRKDEGIAKIYAAGFNEKKIVSMGEKTIKWKKPDGRMDGFTTNGVLIVHPMGQFCDGDSQYGVWREVSVGGDVYSMRENRLSDDIGTLIETESNVLKDGTLINLCGATLLWRSAEGLAKSPNKFDVEELIGTINSENVTPNCPVSRLVVPRKLSSSGSELKPHAYVMCGHVQSYTHVDLEKTSESKCPTCEAESSIVKLCMGLEPAFYTDYGPPTCAFTPCGHMATERTVKNWAKVSIPHGLSSYIAICPFCAEPLAGYPGYINLLFSV